ncbi:MAG: SCO family protein [Pseudomonadota bacterium]
MPRTHFLRFFLLLVFVSVTACSPPAPKFKAMDVTGIGWGGDFALTAHSGKRVKASDFQGKVVILFFGFTHCPDVCAPTLSRLAALMQRLGDDANRVQVLFVTVDPEHDTVKQLASFVPPFHPSFIGLTGSEQEIAKVAQDYKVAFGKNPASQPGKILVDHSTSLMVKDAKGALRLLVKNDVPVEDLEHDIRVLLKE